MNSLGTRLFAAFLAIIVLVILLVGFALLVLLRDNPAIERGTITRLNDVVRTVARQNPPPLNARLEALTLYAQQVAEIYEVRVLVAEANGRVLADSDSSGALVVRLNPALSRPDPALPPGGEVGRVRDANRRLWLYVTLPLGPDRFVAFALEQPRLPALAYFVENLALPLTEAGCLAGLLAVVLAVLIARSIASPLHRMAGVAQSIARGDYSHVAPAAGPDEVRALGQSLNVMSAQVQAAAQAQRDFVANVSHELKTPLTSIQGFAQAMLDGAAASPEALHRSARIIFDEAERMRRLVEELLDLARLDAGAGAMQRAPVDLGLILQSMADRFAPRAAEKRIGLTVNAGTLPSLIGDSDRLAQVFTNLVDNALKHTPTGGHVTLGASPAPGGVEVIVRDSGLGIPAEDLSRIFERFYQVDKSRAHAGGAGLGLAIAKGIVETHGGKISVHSVVGAGTTFRVFLPAAQADDTTVARRRGKQ